MGGVKDKIITLYETNINKDYNKPKCIIRKYGHGKKPRKPKIKNDLKAVLLKI